MQPIFLAPVSSMPVTLSIPISQVALATLWAVSGGRIYLRAIVTLVVIIVCWFAVMRFLGTVNAVGAAHWLTGFAVESAVIAIGVFLLRRRYRMESIRQFGLFSLMMWTTLIAITLVLLKISYQRFGWSPNIAASAHFWGTPFFFVGFAVAALAVATVVVSPPKQMPRRAAYALAIIAGVGIGMPILANLIWTSQLLVTIWEYIGIVFWEVIAIVVSCFPLHFLVPKLQR